MRHLGAEAKQGKDECGAATKRFLDGPKVKAGEKLGIQALEKKNSLEGEDLIPETVYKPHHFSPYFR